jgi:chromosome segregation ATPase
MMRLWIAGMLAAAAWTASAQQQVPVEDLARAREQAIQSWQYRAGEAYSEWGEARYQARLAEQDVLNLEDAQPRGSWEVEELKRRLDAAKKAFAAAKARETAARQTYEHAVKAVDSARRDAAPAR